MHWLESYKEGFDLQKLKKSTPCVWQALVCTPCDPMIFFLKNGSWGGHTWDYNIELLSCISPYNDINIIMKLVFFIC
jgi:hypothetical protein